MTWITFLWKRIIGSLWFMPVMMSLAAVGLVITCGYLDQMLGKLDYTPFFLYAGDVDSARTLLATVAGSIITVAGVAFSVTMVALSLASSQFGPHLLINFMQDRGNQIVLGGFIATFLFCLLALGTTTQGGEAYASLCATVGLVMTVASLALLIYFIHHIAASMQADQVVAQVVEGVLPTLDRFFPPEPTDAPDAPDTSDAREAPPDQAPVVKAPRTGYLQAVDEEGLVRLAEKADVCLRLMHRPGAFIIEDTPLLQVNAGRERRLSAQRLQDNFIIGEHRTGYQDPEFGIDQLVEVAVRAMSAGINDPFTAVTCVDRLTGLLCRIAPRAIRAPVRFDASGTPRLHVNPVEFDEMLDAAFDQIRHFSSDIPSVRKRLLEGLTEIGALVEDTERRRTVARHAELLMSACRSDFDGQTLQRMEVAYSKLHEVVDGVAAERRIR